MQIKAPPLTATGVLAIAGLLVGGVVAWRLYRAARDSAAGAVVDAAARAWEWTWTPQESDKPSVNLGGLPPPEDVSDDPRVARWLIDRAGYLAASKWFTMTALVRAATMDTGSGTPPPVGSELDKQFGLNSGYIDFGKGDGW